MTITVTSPDEKPESSSLDLNDTNKHASYDRKGGTDPKSSIDDNDDDNNNDISHYFVQCSDSDKPEWLRNDNFYKELSTFVSRCNASVKLAIWKKCFTRHGEVMEQISTVRDVSKLISAMVIVFLKYQDKSRPLVKERNISPFLKGCAMYLLDMRQSIQQNKFVQKKIYFSTMLKEYHVSFSFFSSFFFFF